MEKMKKEEEKEAGKWSNVNVTKKVNGLDRKSHSDRATDDLHGWHNGEGEEYKWDFGRID